MRKAGKNKLKSKSIFNICFILMNLGIEQKIKKIFEMPRNVGFIARFGLLSGLKDEIIYSK